MKAQRKELRNNAAKRLAIIVLVSGLALIAWTVNMIMIIIMIADIDQGVIMFLEVTTLLYKIYGIWVGIGLFIFIMEHVLLEYIRNKGFNNDKEIVVEVPGKNKNKY